MGIDANTLATFFENAARLAEIRARGEFADDHDIKARHDVRLKRREVRQRVKTLSWAQVGKKVHLFAQTQQAAFWLYRKVQIVIGRSAHSTQKNGVNFLGFGHRVVMQRCAMGIICCAAHEVYADVKSQTTFVTIPFDDAANLRHDFLANAVARQDKERWVAHGSILRFSRWVGPSPYGAKDQETKAKNALAACNVAQFQMC